MPFLDTKKAHGLQFTVPCAFTLLKTLLPQHHHEYILFPPRIIHVAGGYMSPSLRASLRQGRLRDLAADLFDRFLRDI